MTDLSFINLQTIGYCYYKQYQVLFHANDLYNYYNFDYFTSTEEDNNLIYQNSYLSESQEVFVLHFLKFYSFQCLPPTIHACVLIWDLKVTFFFV